MDFQIISTEKQLQKEQQELREKEEKQKQEEEKQRRLQEEKLLQQQKDADALAALASTNDETQVINMPRTRRRRQDLDKKPPTPNGNINNSNATGVNSSELELSLKRLQLSDELPVMQQPSPLQTSVVSTPEPALTSTTVVKMHEPVQRIDVPKIPIVETPKLPAKTEVRQENDVIGLEQKNLMDLLYANQNVADQRGPSESDDNSDTTSQKDNKVDSSLGGVNVKSLAEKLQSSVADSAKKKLEAGDDDMENDEETEEELPAVVPVTVVKKDSDIMWEKLIAQHQGKV